MSRVKVTIDTDDGQVTFGFDDGNFVLAVHEDGEIGGGETYMDLEQVKFLIDTMSRFVRDYDDQFGDY